MRKNYPFSNMGQYASVMHRSLVLLTWLVAFLLFSSEAKAILRTVGLSGSATAISFASLNWSPGGAGSAVAGDDLRITFSGNRNITGVPGISFGTLTLTSAGSPRSTQMTLDVNTRFTSVILSGGTVITAFSAPLRTSTDLNKLHISGTGGYENGNHTLPSPFEVVAQAVGGNLTINGLPSANTGISHTLTADASPRIITIGSNGISSSYVNASIGTNVTYQATLGTRYSGNITGAGNLTIANTFIMLPGSNLNISGNVTRSVANEIRFGGNVSIGGAFTSTVVGATSTLTLNGTGSQTVSWASGTPQFAGILVSNTTGPISITGNVDITRSTGLSVASSGGFSHTGTLRFTLSAVNSVIDNPGGGAIQFQNLNLVLLGGVCTLAINSSISVSGNMTQDCQLTTGNNNSITVTGNYVQGAALVVGIGGNFTVGGTMTRNQNVTTTFGGNATISGAYTSTGSTTISVLTLNGSGNQTISWGSGAPRFSNVVVSNSQGPVGMSGSLDVNRGTGLTVAASSGFTHSGLFRFDYNNQTGVISNSGGGPVQFQNLSLEQTGGTNSLTINTPISVSGNMTQNFPLTTAANIDLNVTGAYSQGAPLVIGTGGNFTVGGTMSRTADVATTFGGNASIGTYTTTTAPTTSPLTINGSGTQTLSWGGSPVFNTVTVNSGGTLTLSGNVEQRGNLDFTNAGSFTQSSGTWLINLAATFGISNTGGKAIAFNNLTTRSAGGSQVLSISTSFTVNGNYEGNNASTLTISIPSGGPYTWTFNGNFNNDPATGDNIWTAGPLSGATVYNKFIFKGSSVGYGDAAFCNRSNFGGNIHGFDFEFQAPSGGMIVNNNGTAFHGSSTSGLIARDVTITGTNPVTWDCAHTFWIYGNLTNNSTATFQPTKGNAIQTGTFDGDRFYFVGTGTQTIGSAGGALLALNGITTSGTGQTVRLLQNIGLYNGHTGGTDGAAIRTFGVLSGIFDFNGFQVTLDPGTSATKFQQVFWSTAAGNILGSTGSLYVLAAPVPARINLTAAQSIQSLRISGANGCLIGSAANNPLTVTGTLLLESALSTSNVVNILGIGNGAKVIRRTGSVTQGVAGSITYPTNPNFYDLVYDGTSAVTQGAEWANTASVRNLTIGPETGASSTTTVNVTSVGSRTVRGNLVLNSNASFALTTNVGVPIAAGSTILRYGTGSVDKAPSWGSSINVFYGGNLTTGLELPTGGSINVLDALTIDAGSGNTVVLGSSCSPKSNLIVTSGNLNLSTFTANRQAVGGTISIPSGSTLTIGGTGSFPSNYTTNALAANSTVLYNGLGQTISTGIPYANLTISGARGFDNVVFGAGTIQISEVFTPAATFTLGSYAVNTSNTINFNGANGQTIPAFNYNNLSSTNNNRTLVGNIGIAGVFTPGTGAYTVTGSTVNYNGKNSQTVQPFSYHNLSISGSRTTSSVTLSGAISVAGTFNPSATFTSGGYVTSGSTVAFIGNSQTIPNIPGVGYAGLNINQATGNATLSESVTVAGTLNLTAGQLILGSRTLTLRGTSVTRTSGTITSINGASGSELVFNGTGSLTLPNGLFTSSPAGFKNITMNRGGGAEVTFGNQDLNITGLVTLGAAGFLNTGTGKFDLGTTGELSGEANDPYVRGQVEAERAVVLPASTINFANMGVRMKDYTQNVGANLRVLRSAGVAASISPGNSPGLSGNSTARTRWSVSNVSVQPTAGIQLELTWFGDNDNIGGCGACNVNSMAIFTRPTASDPWERMRLGTVWTNADAGGGLRRLYVNAKHFSDFTPGYEAAPLPIVLASLRGTVVKQGVRVSWNTLQEKNGSHFMVERRDAGQTEFTTVGRVEAVGNSSTINSYNFLDAGHEGNAYYRLKMVDEDGSWEYSTVAYVSRTSTDRSLAIVPNPARDLVILNTTGLDMAAMMTTSVLGADGRVLWQAEGTVQQLQAQINSMLPELPAGAYMVRIMDGASVLNTKFVKQ